MLESLFNKGPATATRSGLHEHLDITVINH